MLFKVILLCNTLGNLKISQLIWQVFYRVKSKCNLKVSTFNVENIYLLKFQKQISQIDRYQGNLKFRFLNLEKHFLSTIDWDFIEYGKLWNYNLEYFDYLQQNNISDIEKIALINDFYQYAIVNKRVLEPYPVSLRSINIIRFFLRTDLNDRGFLKFVNQELDYLDKHYEYHILGNHLLENAFALCMGGAFFKNVKWHNRAKKILQQQLQEQILKDGAHFELSPMYHQIILYRVLELIDWYSSYSEKEETFEIFVREIAQRMCSWLVMISFVNGDIPLFNDAANGITYTTTELLSYAQMLGVDAVHIQLKDSGYRSFKNESYEIKVDFAAIGASYQPGHAHADALSFILYHNDQPLFVEQGTSTYQIGVRRNLERATEAHNTVVVAKRDQSEVWGGFRVGKRAKTTIVKDSTHLLEAFHDGYGTLNCIHKRCFSFDEKSVKIDDLISNGNMEAKCYFHLHPSRELVQVDSSTVQIDKNLSIQFEGAKGFQIEEYQYAESYNTYRKASRIVISFKKQLNTTIHF